MPRLPTPGSSMEPVPGATDISADVSGIPAGVGVAAGGVIPAGAGVGVGGSAGVGAGRFGIGLRTGTARGGATTIPPMLTRTATRPQRISEGASLE